MQHSTNEYVIRPAEPRHAPLIARQRASMFRDMGNVSLEESELLRKASEPWLFELLASGEYLGWLVEHERTVVAGGGASRISTQSRRIGGADWRVG